MRHDIYSWLFYTRIIPLLAGIAYFILKFLVIEIPHPVKVGDYLEGSHEGLGEVIHPRATIGERVRSYPGVTLGNAGIYRPAVQLSLAGIVVDDYVFLLPGAKILFKEGVLRIG